ncbi:7757_t:CDS:1, partial [Cetraspora pellucida]
QTINKKVKSHVINMVNSSNRNKIISKVSSEDNVSNEVNYKTNYEVDSKDNCDKIGSRNYNRIYSNSDKKTHNSKCIFKILFRVLF